MMPASSALSGRNCPSMNDSAEARRRRPRRTRDQPRPAAAAAVCLVGAVAAFVWLPGDIGRKAVSWAIAALAIVGVFGLLTYAFGVAAICRTRRAIRHHQGDRRQQRRRPDRHRRPCAHPLRQRRLSRAFAAPRTPRTCARSSACSPARRRSRRRSTGWRRPRARASAPSRNCASPRPLVGRGRRGLVSRCASGRSRARRPAPRCGPSPTSPASASGTRASSRNCSTRSTISTTPPPASSRPSPTARSST